MNDEFRMDLFQTDDDIKSESNFKRTCTLKYPNNEALGQLKVQIPIVYDGLKNEAGVEQYYTPEDLFLSAVTGCFFTTFNVVSQNSNFKYSQMSISSTGIISNSTGVKIMEKITQDIELIIPKDMSEKKGLKLLQMTEQRCVLGNSVKSKIENKFSVKFQ